jgi:hypothetical protein
LVFFVTFVICIATAVALQVTARANVVITLALYGAFFVRLNAIVCFTAFDVIRWF